MAAGEILDDELMQTSSIAATITTSHKTTTVAAGATAYLAVLEASCVKSDPPVRLDVLDLSLRGRDKIPRGKYRDKVTRHQAR